MKESVKATRPCSSLKKTVDVVSEQKTQERLVKRQATAARKRDMDEQMAIRQEVLRRRKEEIEKEKQEVRNAHSKLEMIEMEEISLQRRCRESRNKKAEIANDNNCEDQQTAVRIKK